LKGPFAVPGYCTLGPDAIAGGRPVVDHLLSVHGHRSVAFIAGETGVHEPEAREARWRDALRSPGRPEGLLMRTLFTRAGGDEAAQRVLTGADCPTAMFVSSDLQAFGVCAIRERALDVPRDVALVTFDDIEESTLSWPPLTLA
jgi:LacI family transcriptional regulator